ncbi:EamA family transporter [Hydrogenophaga sp.]|uniref:EamA family transporter n=1 Tax=Hydrogenophaga sp. TaxID=1904254 RepID=UPI0026304200|nr:EamA family transporter [Hydrogenophaga sp.]MCW5653755.1 EamA family transporter [Hydrogenophaga sp.]
MPTTHLLLAFSVVFVWGTNFVVIRWGLDGLPPFLMVALRMALSALPALFLPRPTAPWRKLAAFGVLLGAGQFGLLYLAMRHDISPGMASLVLQSQVFFTIGLSLLLMGERVRGYQVAGLLLALAGLGLIAANVDATVTLLGMALVLTAAFFWACANLVVKSLGPVNMLHFTIWSSLFAVPPLLAISLWVEGPQAMLSGLQHANARVWASVVWQALGNTLFGYGAWNWLLSRHPAATVTPWALLVPVFGIGTSAITLGEALPAWKLGAAALVLGGLAIIVCWPLLQRRSAAVRPGS